MPSMAALLQEEQYKVDLPQRGELRTGVIASISPSQILVSIGAKSEGVIAGRALEDIPPEERKAFQVGQEITAYVINPEDKHGNVILSYTRAQEQMAWEAVESMLDSDEVFEGTISGYNKGGLIVSVRGLRGFVPASQVSAVRRSMAVGETPEQRWAKMNGEPIAVRIIEVDRERRRLILSERAASNESRQSIKERVIDDLVIGETYTGRVTSLANFGAFVNINGADGLVHLSELSWERVQHPSEALEVGQEVKVKVISIDKEKRRIGLSLRQLSDDPWKAKIEKFQVGQLIEGTVTRLTKFGAFARLEGDIEGLIHVSEISDHRIEHPKEVLKEGDVVILRIIRIDPDRRRIGLSMRKVDSAAYADKDMKALAKELAQDEPESPPVEQLEEPVEEQPEEQLEEQPEEAPEEISAEIPEEKTEAPAETEKIEETEEPVGEIPPEEKETSEEAPEVSAEAPAEETAAENPPEEPEA
ncbi:MAG: S1 RNA-binding domain-containing protein [Chloroflexi bacterium]|nr:S1 RNA-binding domain-containing protein [Chloroflexota bacterium]